MRLGIAMVLVFCGGLCLGIGGEKLMQAMKNATLMAEMEEYDRTHASDCRHEGKDTICRWQTND